MANQTVAQKWDDFDLAHVLAQREALRLAASDSNDPHQKAALKDLNTLDSALLNAVDLANRVLQGQARQLGTLAPVKAYNDDTRDKLAPGEAFANHLLKNPLLKDAIGIAVDPVNPTQPQDNKNDASNDPELQHRHKLSMTPRFDGNKKKALENNLRARLEEKPRAYPKPLSTRPF